MRNERVLWSLAVVGLIAFHSFGQPQPAGSPEPVVVSMTGSITQRYGGDSIRLYRIWSNGLTEERSWNNDPRHNVASLRWTEWKPF